MGFVWLERKLILAFDGYGRFVCRHPLPFLLIPLIFSVLVAGGILMLKLDDGVIMLFTPLHAPARREISIVRQFDSVLPKPDDGPNVTDNDKLPYAGDEEYVGSWFRIQISYKDQRNLINPETWQDLSELMKYIYNNFTCVISNGDNPIRLRYNPDFCNPDRGCPRMEDYVSRVADILNTSYNTKMGDNIRLTYPVMYVFNKPFNWAQLIHGAVINQVDGILQSAPVVSLLLQFQYAKTKLHMENNAQHCMKQLANYLTNLTDQNYGGGLRLSPFSERIMDMEVMKTRTYVLPYLAATIGLILFFTVASSMEPKFLAGSAFESFMGVATIGLSLLASFGFIFLCGRYFNAVVTMAPFLVMCVGIDNDFLLMAAYRQTDPRQSPQNRIGAAFASAGPSLTITSITDIFCFGIGFLSDTPTVANFCLYTSVSLAFRYVFQLTFFAAIMSYVVNFESKHDRGNENRCIVSIKHLLNPKKDDLKKKPIPAKPDTPNDPSDYSPKQHWAHKFFQHYYGPFLMLKPVRLIILIVFGIYLVFVLIWSCKMQINISPQKLVVDDSPLVNYFKVAEQYSWTDAVLAHVFVNHPPDFRNKSEIDKFMKFVTELANSTEYRAHEKDQTDVAGLWLYDYLPYLDFVAQMNDNYNDDFYDYIGQFLSTTDYSKYWLDLRFKPRLNESGPLELVRFRYTAFYRGVDSWEKHVELLQFWRSICDQYSQYDAFVYDHHNLNVYLDQRLTLEPTTLQTSGIAILSMAFVTAIFMPDIASVFYICLSFLSVDLGVVGFLSFWNTDLDPISMVCILMTIGFSVYYTARICYCYQTIDPKLSPYDKVALTLGTVGWPILQGGLATLLGILPLAFVRSNMVRVFFKTVALLVLIGLFHGLLVMPVVMSSLDQSRPPRRKLAKNASIKH